MRRYLPDKYPLFWHEVRRRMFGRRWFILPAIALGLLVLVVGGVVALMIVLHAPLTNGDFLVLPFLQGIEGVLVLAFAPALSGGLIANERERGTLESLFLTTLTPRQIVMQKYCAALIPLLGILLLFSPVQIALLYKISHPGVPSAMSMEMYDPSIAIWAINWAGAVVAVFCYCAIGIFISSLARNTRTALVVSYVVIIIGLNVGTYIIGLVLYFMIVIVHHEGDTLFTPLFPMCLFTLLTFVCLLGSIRAVARLRRPA